MTNEGQDTYISESKVDHSILAEIVDQSISMPQSFSINDSEGIELNKTTSTYNGTLVSKTVNDTGLANLPFNYTIPSFENMDSEKTIGLNIESVHQDVINDGDCESDDSLFFWTEEEGETSDDPEGLYQEIFDVNAVFNVNLLDQPSYPWIVDYVNRQELYSNTIISFDFFPYQLDIDPSFFALISFRFIFLEYSIEVVPWYYSPTEQGPLNSTTQRIAKMTHYVSEWDQQWHHIEYNATKIGWEMFNLVPTSLETIEILVYSGNNFSMDFNFDNLSVKTTIPVNEANISINEIRCNDSYQIIDEPIYGSETLMIVSDNNLVSINYNILTLLTYSIESSIEMKILNKTQFSFNGTLELNSNETVNVSFHRPLSWNSLYLYDENNNSIELQEVYNATIYSYEIQEQTEKLVYKGKGNNSLIVSKEVSELSHNEPIEISGETLEIGEIFIGILEKTKNNFILSNWINSTLLWEWSKELKNDIPEGNYTLFVIFPSTEFGWYQKELTLVTYSTHIDDLSFERLAYFENQAIQINYLDIDNLPISDFTCYATIDNASVELLYLNDEVYLNLNYPSLEIGLHEVQIIAQKEDYATVIKTHIFEVLSPNLTIDVYAESSQYGEYLIIQGSAEENDFPVYNTDFSIMFAESVGPFNSKTSETGGIFVCIPRPHDGNMEELILTFKIENMNFILKSNVVLPSKTGLHSVMVNNPVSQPQVFTNTNITLRLPVIYVEPGNAWVVSITEEMKPIYDVYLIDEDGLTNDVSMNSSHLWWTLEASENTTNNFLTLVTNGPYSELHYIGEEQKIHKFEVDIWSPDHSFRNVILRSQLPFPLEQNVNMKVYDYSESVIMNYSLNLKIDVIEISYFSLDRGISLKFILEIDENTSEKDSSLVMISVIGLGLSTSTIGVIILKKKLGTNLILDL
ncbi:MAG: hypothetical protein KAR35_00380 [Candidatus Heimdallarchaeota archaeon]|nr:hypothetical protein [Candidatus Heimdallarchaeota archaeon]MCK5047807.1 hypothetical protein [Candidatus Heimdallarchaeota archaeon]